MVWGAATTIGFIAMGVAIGLIWKKKFNRFTLGCCVISGFAVAYPLAEWGGPVLERIDNIAAWVSVNLILAGIASVFLFFDFKEKGIKKINLAIGFLAPVLFLLAGGPFLLPLEAAGEGITALDNAVTQAQMSGR